MINARVELGDGVYVGSNASIMPDLRVGQGAVIEANSAVVQNIPAGASVIGVPAQIVMQDVAAPPLRLMKVPTQKTLIFP